MKQSHGLGSWCGERKIPTLDKASLDRGVVLHTDSDFSRSRTFVYTHDQAIT